MHVSAQPIIMGILNLTTDSFHAGSRALERSHVQSRIESMCEEGAEVIDLGWVSTRPGAQIPSESQEFEWVNASFPWLQKQYPKVRFSIDTFRASVAKLCLDHGVAYINDVSGGRWDADMYSTMANYRATYILMHSKERPGSMQQNPHYDDLMTEVTHYFSEHIQKARQSGVRDIIIDPGFGFAKSVEHNFELLAKMDQLRIFDLPILVGLSRKSMVQKILNVDAENALNGTSVLNTIALLKGAQILRVHDVRQAVECVALTQKFTTYECSL